MFTITRPRLALAGAVLFAGLAIAPFALAQSVPQQGGAQVLSLGEIETRMAAQGYRVVEIEREPHKYEVRALNAQGQCVKLDLDLYSGAVRRTRFDDDCGRSSSHHSGDDHANGRRRGRGD